MPGPLPNPNRRRRNAPTVPTTELPASGRKGRAPNCPYTLGPDGTGWWRWAWTLPQAAAWSKGDLYVVARRARLEDDIGTLGFAELGLTDLLDGGDPNAIRRVEDALNTLKRLCSSKLAIEKEMRELDDKLGLSPKAMAYLRWKIVDDEPKASTPAPAGWTSSSATVAPEGTIMPTRPRPRAARSSHLRAVDPGEVAIARESPPED